LGIQEDEGVILDPVQEQLQALLRGGKGLLPRAALTAVPRQDPGSGPERGKGEEARRGQGRPEPPALLGQAGGPRVPAPFEVLDHGGLEAPDFVHAAEAFTPLHHGDRFRVMAALGEGHHAVQLFEFRECECLQPAPGGRIQVRIRG
jgi:hypothetical protein